MAHRLKYMAFGIGSALVGLWLVLFFVHVLFALIWVFFWVGLAALLLAFVLHAIERWI